MKSSNAKQELLEFLLPAEKIEAIVLGSTDPYGEEWDSKVPQDKQGVVLTFEEAAPYLEGWSFIGGYGTYEGAPAYVWTDQRVITVGVYDGSSWLQSIPRNPSPGLPTTCGGG